MGNIQKPAGLNKAMDGLIVATGSRMMRILLLLAILCGGFLTIYTEINRVFPIETDEIHGMTIQNEQTKPVIGPWEQQFLEQDDLNIVVQSINELKLTHKQSLGHTISTLTLDETRYSIRIIYEAENSLRSKPVAWLYFMDNCKLIVDYGGYTQYQIVEPHYKNFLNVLDEMAIKCEVEK